MLTRKCGFMRFKDAQVNHKFEMHFHLDNSSFVRIVYATTVCLCLLFIVNLIIEQKLLDYDKNSLEMDVHGKNFDY